MVKNWLTQRTVSRDAVLLLGFGLGMRVEDVQELLTKGLQESELSLTDPRETVCGYCYLHGMGYHKYKALMSECEQTSGITADRRISAPASLKEIRSNEELLAYVASLIRAKHDPFSPTALSRHFSRLYAQAQKVTASTLSMTTKTQRNWAPDEITPADIEQVLQAAIPRDAYGNLQPAKRSSLNSQFRGKRLTRQRLTELLNGTAQATRYDLLLLQFYVTASDAETAQSRLDLYRSFTEQTNQLLKECGMSPLYPVNPFECFLMMCMLTEDPMTAYSDVMERSYTEGRP